MDPVTHGLAGALISEAGFARKLGGRARWVMPVAAMFPDIDIVYRIEGLPAYIANHRALTHSFAGILVSGLLMGIVLGRLDEERRYLAWISACWVALFSHQVLDLITSFGTCVLYPFSRTRFYFDWVFIIDIFLSGMLLAFWLLSRRRNESDAQKMAVRGLGIVAGYILFCALNHNLAIHQLKKVAMRNQMQYQSVAAIPQILMPLRWSGVVDIGTHYYLIPMYSFRTPAPPFQIFTKTTGSYFEQKARATEMGVLYTWFARYPVVTERVEEQSHIVEFSDLRFYMRFFSFMVRKPFVLRIKMDRDGNVLETRFGRM